MSNDADIYEEPNSKPEFITFPEPLCVVEGEPARFTTRLNGKPTPRVLWFKDDGILADVSVLLCCFFQSKSYYRPLRTVRHLQTSNCQRNKLEYYKRYIHYLFAQLVVAICKGGGFEKYQTVR